MAAPFTTLAGHAAPLMVANIDTDVIIRMDYLTGGDWSGIGEHAFASIRYLPDGTENPDFALNQPRFRGAPILVAGPNFGCGSSREAAVTALMAMGLRCVVAESFGDIFYANCFQNGMLPVHLPETEVLELATAAEGADGRLAVDLAAQTVTTADGRLYRFEIDALRKIMLLEGLDDIGLTLKEEPAIAAWQATDRQARPWIWETRTA